MNGAFARGDPPRRSGRPEAPVKSRTNPVVFLSHRSGRVLVCYIRSAGKHFGFAATIHSGAKRTRA
jgi:hypothetical protein